MYVISFALRPHNYFWEKGHKLNVLGYHKPKSVLHVLTTLSNNQRRALKSFESNIFLLYSSDWIKTNRTTQENCVVLVIVINISVLLVITVQFDF